MPRKIERKFEAEYGKKKGRLIFYKWRNKMKPINLRKVKLLGIGGKR